MKAAIYLRISDDHNGEQRATVRQREDCDRLAASNGWTVAEVFEDVDVSAFKRRARPQFDRMLQAVEAHEVDVVVAWKLDRLARQHRDLTRLFDACEASGAFIRTVADGVDTRTDSGRLVAEVTTSVARAESQNTSARVARWHRQRVADGKPNGGGRRAFGYEQGRTRIVPSEAKLIREGAKRIIGGASVRSVASEWERRGIVTPSGRPWSARSLQRMIGSAHLSAQREHDGVLTAGKWKPILKPEQTAQLRAIFANPARTMPGRDKRVNLLSGILRCGICDAVLHSHPRADRARRYACKRIPGRGGCGGLARLAEPVEALVSEAVMVALDGADITGMVAESQDSTVRAALDSISAAEASLEQLSRDYYVDQAITRAEYFAARDALQTRLDEQRAALERNEHTRVLRDVVDAGQRVRDLWPKRGIDWQRAAIGAVVDHVTLMPAVKGRTTFDPSLVRIVWRF